MYVCSTTSCPGHHLNYMRYHQDFVHRYISLSRSTVHKKHNPVLPYLGVIVLCSFFYTLNIVRNITLKLYKISTRNPVGNSSSLSRSAMHKHRYSVLLILFVIALCLIFTLNFVGDITLKLQEISTRTFVHRLISLSRSAVHKHCNSA